jgi:hypothetical protein
MVALLNIAPAWRTDYGRERTRIIDGKGCSSTRASVQQALNGGLTAGTIVVFFQNPLRGITHSV